MPSIKQLDETTDYNIPDDHGNVPLHTAVIRKDLNMLEHLLQQSNIDVNYKNNNGETPLMLCMWQHTTDLFILRLIQSGSNLSLTNNFGQTCLHVAVISSSINIAPKLIENGADVNAIDQKKYTALHYAVDINNVEAVYMLLYYRIDVSILCKDNLTAFTLALYNDNLDLAKALFNYCNDFSEVNQDGTALYWAARHRGPLVLNLIAAIADVNSVPNNVLEISLRYDNAELFKLIWPKFNHHLLLEGTTSFIERFISKTESFSASDWVECMYLILDSPVAFELLNHWSSLLSIYNVLPVHRRCVFQLLYRLEALEVEPSDRIGIIASCLSLGWQADEDAINLAFILYGFGPELELLIYSMNVYDRFRSNSTLHMVPLCIFALDGELGSKDIIDMLHSEMHEANMDEQSVNKFMLRALRFFALSFGERQQLQFFYDFYFPRGICNLLNNVPKLPSLLELSRNKTRQCIRQRHKMYRSYHMLDAVKSLDLPQHNELLTCLSAGLLE